MQANRIPLLVLLVVVGCSAEREPRVEPRHDSEQASVALTAALEAWKKGEARGLSKRKPPIRFVDDDFVRGWHLLDYEIEEPDRPIMPHVDVEVILSLRDPQGKAVRREIHYQVSTSPGLAVLRSDSR